MAFVVLLEGVQKKHDRRHIFPKRLQNPHAEAAVAGTETKSHQLACAPFHIFRSGAFIKNDENIRFLKMETSKHEEGFHLVLLTVDNENAWLVVHEVVVGFVKKKVGQMSTM